MTMDTVTKSADTSTPNQHTGINHSVTLIR